MKISTKVECGIIAIADIAMNSENGETVTVYSVAERRGLSGKYLEQVLDDYIWLRLENKLKSYTESITLRQLVDFYNKESAENVSEPMYYI